MEATKILNCFPSTQNFTVDPCHDTVVPQPDDSPPIIDYSLLVSGAPEQRAKLVGDLGKACEEWGVFLVINHEVPENIMKAVINASSEFFHMEEEDKQEYKMKSAMWDPLQLGRITETQSSIEKIHMWRDSVKVFISPDFHPPNKPSGFSDTALEFSQRAREVARNLLGGVSESLGLESNYIDEAMDMDKGYLFFSANFYPPYPQSGLTMGLPAHSDYGLLTLLIHNGIPGLQILRNNEWIDIESIPNAFIVNVGDNLEVLSNRKYKSLVHRATVNSKETRISIVLAHGPSLESTVKPIPEVLEKEGQVPTYMPIKYKEFIELKYAAMTSRETLDLLKIRQ